MRRVLVFVVLLGVLGGCVVATKSPPPPPLHARPRIVLIREIGVYYAPDLEFDVYFYRGVWYRPHKGLWYYSEHHGGPWVVIPARRLPVALLKIPPRYRKHR